jgi:hypothetical protein
MKQFVFARLREPSTYAAIAAALGSMSFIPHAPEWADVVMKLGAAVAAILGVVMPESKK